MSRTSLIKIIHVASRRLQLDDDTYRAILKRATGKDSCRGMNIAQLESVIKALEDGGFKRTPARSAARRPKKSSGESDKIRVIWNLMYCDGFIGDGSDIALDAWIKRMTVSVNSGEGIAALAWLRGDAAARVLESLKQWHIRLMLKYLKDNQQLTREIRSYDRVREKFLHVRKVLNHG